MIIKCFQTPFWSTIAFLLILQGCASLPDTVSESSPHPAPSSVEINEDKLASVRLGMTLSDVIAVMGKEIVVGYTSEEGAKAMSPVVVQNPYRVELVSAGGHDYVIYYYVSSIKKSDDTITDDELLPVIFENDFVVGTGWKSVLIIKANAADES